MMDHFDRGYQAGREELHTGIEALLRHLVTSISAVFDAIHRIQFSAPWADPRPR